MREGTPAAVDGLVSTGEGAAPGPGPDGRAEAPIAENIERGFGIRASSSIICGATWEICWIIGTRSGNAWRSIGASVAAMFAACWSIAHMARTRALGVIAPADWSCWGPRSAVVSEPAGRGVACGGGPSVTPLGPRAASKGDGANIGLVPRTVQLSSVECQHVDH